MLFDRGLSGKVFVDEVERTKVADNLLPSRSVHDDTACPKIPIYFLFFFQQQTLLGRKNPVNMSDYAHVPGGSLKFKGAGEK